MTNPPGFVKADSQTHGAVPSQSGRHPLFVATRVYTALIIYGSLYPLTGWRFPSVPLFAFLTEPGRDPTNPLSDVLTNVLVYIPLGVLLVWALNLKGRIWSAVTAVLAGGALSLTMESIQMFLPSRMSSAQDLLNNVIGTLLGATLGITFRPDTAIMSRLRRVRDEWLVSDRGADAGLVAVCVWALSQLSPFVPTLDVSTVRQGLSPLWYTLNDPSSLSWLKTVAYALDIAGIGLLATTVTRTRERIVPFFLLFAGFVLCLKPFIVSRQISLEAICGLMAAAVLLMIAPKARALRALLSMLAVFAGFVTQELTPSGGTTHAFNWIPFAGQMDNTVAGFGSILESLWPFVALSALAMLGFGVRRRPMIYLGSILLALVFALEWVQQGIAGRYGDITTVILAAAGWSFPWLAVSWRRAPVITAPAHRPCQ